MGMAERNFYQAILLRNFLAKEWIHYLLYFVKYTWENWRKLWAKEVSQHKCDK